MRVSVLGAGVAGLATAAELAERGFAVEVLERGNGLGVQSASWYAGGMLAPWCERESAEAEVAELGQAALDWWPRHYPGTVRHGTLVVAPPRDTSELLRFARRTGHYEQIDSERIAALEPDLAGRFRSGLFFPEEAHLDPRKALQTLAARIEAAGGTIRFGVTADPATIRGRRVIDCRGMATTSLPELRGVRGEMLLIRTKDVSLSRPVRLLHPRFPLYVVPRENGLFMVGATMLESAEDRGASVRSVVELLNAAFALHPAFGEAEIVEIGVGVRPAFPDNMPRLVERDGIVHINGFYRHGFLLAPALAQQAAETLLRQEVEAVP